MPLLPEYARTNRDIIREYIPGTRTLGTFTEKTDPFSRSQPFLVSAFPRVPVLPLDWAWCPTF